MAESSEINPKSSKAQKFFEYGNDATIKVNFDYAMSMYREALKLDPGNLLYRQALRGVQRRTFGNEPSKVGRMAGARVQPIKLGVKTSKSRGKWSDVLEGCEDVFKHNPWDIGATEDAAEAAEQLEFPTVAQWLMESVVVQAGDNESFFIHLGRIYENNQLWDRAISCWERANKINPGNEEARRKVRSLAASATISRSGLAGSIQRSSAAPAEPTAAEKAMAEAEELKRVSQTPEERLLKEIEAEPTHVGLYLQLADLYKTGNRLDDAEKALARGRKAAPEDEVLKSVHADVQMSRLRRAIDHWTKKSRENPDDVDAPIKLEQIKEKLAGYELSEFRRRVELRPEDAALRMQYGRLLASAAKHDEAIAEFQQAKGNPDLKVQALHLLGQAFEAKKMPKLAERNYQEALRLADPADRNLFKALHYRLGVVAEQQNDVKAAEEHYNEVADEDYTYLDVADRLKGLNDRA